ncbi:MAG: large subunit ribosomal protein L22 [Rickettsiales bacterium]|jgi:large subunit ribosomal protein L22
MGTSPVIKLLKSLKVMSVIKEKKQKEVEEKTAVAYLNAIKSSPLKVMKLTRNLSNLPVAEVLMKLQFCNLKVAKPVRDLVYSAMSNAENNHNMDVDNLFIKRIDVGRAFALKRFSARARGRSSQLLKTFSNIRVVLVEKQN